MQKASIQVSQYRTRQMPLVLEMLDEPARLEAPGFSAPNLNALQNTPPVPNILPWRTPMFDLDRLFADCQDAVAQAAGLKGVQELVARAVSEPNAVIAALGEPQRAGITILHHSPCLTILNLVWGAGMTIMPHDHQMLAVIGVYTGREDNIFWRRLPVGANRAIEAAGARSLCRGDCTQLGADIIHSVTNPIPRLTGAIHAYGGDFVNQERSEWNAETLHEHRYDVAKALQLFEDSNKGSTRG
jgi:predicted metal-dependent enzyme (double-stranded beta helix superfamily)